MNVLLLFLVGLAAAGLVGRTSGTLSAPARVAVGVAGALLGSFVLGLLGPLARGPFGSLFTATGGAVALLVVVGLIARKP